MNDTQVNKAASLIHDLWVEWSKYLTKHQYYDIPTHIVNHWAVNWIPYEQLPEHQKETDRVLARRFLGKMEE